jgi:hypothetical protein
MSSTAIRAQLGIHDRPSSILDSVGQVSSTLDLDFQPSDSEPVGITLHVNGDFSNSNLDIVEPLDGVFQPKFCAKLEASSGHSVLLSSAILFGGYMHVLSSTTTIQVEVRTTVDNVLINTEHSKSDVGLHFRYLLIRRIESFVRVVLMATRENSEDPQIRSEVYTAAFILHTQANNFKAHSGLRDGYPPDPVRSPFQIEAY